MVKTNLHWVRVNSAQWESEEGQHGDKKKTIWQPDFVITYGGAYRLKMRTSRQALWFDTLQEAKDYAESV